MREMIDEWLDDWEPIKANSHILELKIKQALAKKIEELRPVLGDTVYSVKKHLGLGVDE